MRYLMRYLKIKTMQTRRKSAERNIRKISKVGRGSSFSITLPIEMIRDLGWKEHQKVEAKRVHGGILIRDWKGK